VSYILDKDKQALIDISPQLKLYHDQMQQAINQRKISIENERQPTFKPFSYEHEQPKQKKAMTSLLTKAKLN
jgi:hypothetical protein